MFRTREGKASIHERNAGDLAVPIPNHEESGCQDLPLAEKYSGTDNLRKFKFSHLAILPQAEKEKSLPLWPPLQVWLLRWCLPLLLPVVLPLPSLHCLISPPVLLQFLLLLFLLLAMLEEGARRQAEARTEAEKTARVLAEWRAEIEMKARQEAEARTEAGEMARIQAEARAETEVKARQEVEARIEAEKVARIQAEARAELEVKARQEVEARIEAEKMARIQAEARAETEIKARQEVEARIEVEKIARIQAEARAETEIKARWGVEARMEAKEGARILAERRGKIESRTDTWAHELVAREPESILFDKSNSSTSGGSGTSHWSTTTRDSGYQLSFVETLESDEFSPQSTTGVKPHYTVASFHATATAIARHGVGAGTFLSDPSPPPPPPPRQQPLPPPPHHHDYHHDLGTITDHNHY